MTGPPLAETGSILPATRRRVTWLPAERRPIQLDWASIQSGRGAGHSIEGSFIIGLLLIWMETLAIPGGLSSNGMRRERNGSGMCLIMLYRRWGQLELTHLL